MSAVAFFDSRLLRPTSLKLPGEQVRREVYPFPDRKLAVIAGSNGDGRTGKAVLHSSELRERTKGATEYLEIPNSFRLQALLEHIERGGKDEEERLKLRIGELKTAGDYLMKSGKLKEGDVKEIFQILHAIERDLAEPKRNGNKLAASRNVRRGTEYRSPKAGNPVGPVIAITAKAAVQRLERRIAEILGVRQFANLRHALVAAYNREAEALFKALKEEKDLRAASLSKLINELEYMRMQPFEAPARRIERLYDAFRYGDASEIDTLAAIRREVHSVLLVCVIERQVIRRLSRIKRVSTSEGERKELRIATIASIDKIGKHVAACDSFSTDARAIAATKLGHAREILAQESLFETPQKRIRSADRILKELTAVLPV